MTDHSNRPAWLIPENQDTALPRAHFSAANGLPVAAYGEFFEHFHNHLNLSALDSRGCWPNEPLPARGFNWHSHADDLIAAIESRETQPLTGIGHSMGSVITSLAALKRPELFRKLVLIEPPSTPSWLSYLVLQYSPAWLTHKNFAFIRGSHNRQRTFDSRESFIQRYRNHPTFKHLSERSLRAYAENGLIESPQEKLKLLCHPSWESHNFRKVPYFWPLVARIKLPVLLLRAEHSYLYSAERFNEECASLSTNVTPQQIDNAYHLAPLEVPESVAKLILSWLNDTAT